MCVFEGGEASVPFLRGFVLQRTPCSARCSKSLSHSWSDSNPLEALWCGDSACAGPRQTRHQQQLHHVAWRAWMDPAGTDTTCAAMCLPLWRPADRFLPGFCRHPHPHPQAAARDPAGDGLPHVPVCALLCGRPHDACAPLGLPGPGPGHAHLLRVSGLTSVEHAQQLCVGSPCYCSPCWKTPHQEQQRRGSWHAMRAANTLVCRSACQHLALTHRQAATLPRQLTGSQPVHTQHSRLKRARCCMCVILTHTHVCMFFVVPAALFLPPYAC